MLHDHAGARIACALIPAPTYPLSTAADGSGGGATTTRRATPLLVSVDGQELEAWCAKGRAESAFAAAVPSPSTTTAHTDALGAIIPPPPHPTTTATAAAAAIDASKAGAGGDNNATPVLFQSTLVRRCVLPTLGAGESNRTVTLTATVRVGSDGKEDGDACGFGAGCGSGVVTATARWTLRAPPPGGARNAVLFIGDGMSMPMISAARTALGAATQCHGKHADATSSLFPTDTFEAMGLVHTNSLEALVTDSFASASAYNCGHKALDGAAGVYPDATADPTDDPRVETLAECVACLPHAACACMMLWFHPPPMAAARSRVARHCLQSGATPAGTRAPRLVRDKTD